MRNDRTSVIRNPLYGKGATVGYSSTAGSTAAMQVQGATAIAVLVTTLAYVRVGVSPTAAAGDVPVPPNVLTMIPINDDSGKPLKVSAVQVAASGNCYAIPVQ